MPFDLFSLLIGLMIPLPIIITFFVIIILVWRDSKKSRALYFTTEKTAELRKVVVKDGAVNMGKKMFYVDKKDEGTLKSGVIWQNFVPFYILKWDTPIPAKIEKIKESSKGIVGKIIPNYLTPEALSSYIKNETLTKLLTPPHSKIDMIMFMIIGAVMGVLGGIIVGTNFI